MKSQVQLYQKIRRDFVVTRWTPKSAFLACELTIYAQSCQSNVFHLSYGLVGASIEFDLGRSYSQFARLRWLYESIDSARKSVTNDCQRFLNCYTFSTVCISRKNFSGRNLSTSSSTMTMIPAMIELLPENYQIFSWQWHRKEDRLPFLGIDSYQVLLLWRLFVTCPGRPTKSNFLTKIYSKSLVMHVLKSFCCPLSAVDLQFIVATRRANGRQVKENSQSWPAFSRSAHGRSTRPACCLLSK